MEAGFVPAFFMVWLPHYWSWGWGVVNEKFKIGYCLFWIFHSSRLPYRRRNRHAPTERDRTYAGYHAVGLAKNKQND